MSAFGGTVASAVVLALALVLHVAHMLGRVRAAYVIAALALAQLVIVLVVVRLTHPRSR